MKVVTYNFMFKSSNDTSDTAKASGSLMSERDTIGLLMIVDCSGLGEVEGKMQVVLIR